MPDFEGIMDVVYRQVGSLGKIEPRECAMAGRGMLNTTPFLCGRVMGSEIRQTTHKEMGLLIIWHRRQPQVYILEYLVAS